MKNKYGKIQIVRCVQVDNLEEINLNDFGVHFTSNLNFCYNAADKGVKKEYRNEKRYTAKIFINGRTPQKYTVNEDATKESNVVHPRESEVVLAFNQILTARLVIVENESGRFFYDGKYWGHEGKEVTINTGTRCDEWVKNF